MSLLFKQVSHLNKNNKVLIDIVIPENLHLLGSLEDQGGPFLFQASLILLLTMKWVIRGIGSEWQCL